MNTNQALQAKRDEIIRIASRHGARNIRLIGSRARGDAQENSDVDFLVEFEAGRSLLDHAALMLDLEALLHCKVDVTSDRGLRDRVRSRILTEAKPL